MFFSYLVKSWLVSLYYCITISVSKTNINIIVYVSVTIFIYLEIPPRFLRILRVFLAVFGRSGLQLKYSLPTRLNLTSSIKS
jgi:phage shock protein PspC (stress-responsive transcriptional regulator)